MNKFLKIIKYLQILDYHEFHAAILVYPDVVPLIQLINTDVYKYIVVQFVPSILALFSSPKQCQIYQFHVTLEFAVIFCRAL